jgi:homocysteine S-methyltransferase
VSQDGPPGRLSALLAPGATLVLDGGLATELEAAGHDLSDRLWSARLLRDDPDAIEAAHLAFLRAGADIVETASYQASMEGFVAAGLDGGEAERLLRVSVQLARAACRTFAAERGDVGSALVAASVGPYGAMLADGQEYTGDYGSASLDDVRGFHERRLRTLISAGPDCIACETIPRADEAGVLAGLLDELEAPEAWISFSCRDGHRTAGGDAIEDAVARAVTSDRVVAVGVNCTDPEYVDELLVRCGSVTDRPLIAYPNGGRVWDGRTRTWLSQGADRLPAPRVVLWRSRGAVVIGGCCGLGPAAIAAVAATLGHRAPRL